MTPTLPELLVGTLVALSEPPPPESAGDFMSGKVTVLALISFLASQEAEKGVAVRVAENRAIRALFADAAREEWAADQSTALTALAGGADDDLTLSGVDKANAALRHALIALQTVVEADETANGKARQRRILTLLLDGARSRSLALPGMPS